MNIIVFIITLSILVLIHEFGHFLAAKRRGVLVEEFGLGLPPRIAGIKIGETIYSINFLPFGGFVKLYGEDSEEGINQKLKSRAFAYKNNWEKVLIIVAGVVGNFFLAWLLFSYLFTQGVPVPTNQVKIEKVASGSPAEKVGIAPGDVIKKIISKQDNKTYSLSSGADLITITKKYSGKEIILVVKRNNQEINKTITPRLSPPPGEGPLGIVINSFEEKKYPWYQAPFYGLIDSLKITYKIFAELLKTILTLLSFQKANVDVAGPIGIAYYTSEIIKFGKNAYLEFLALLSLNLAVINLLPFPALDGGRLAFVIYESITKKKIKKELERNLNLIGFIILIFLAIMISINDIIKLIR
jgi:regulator of sigma E protease